MSKTKSAPPKQSAFSNYRFPLIVFAFAFLLYSNTVHHDFVMDDGAMISNHVTVQKGFAGIPELFSESSVFGSTKENFGTYRPLTMSLFAVEKQFFGNDPFGFHLIHVLLYAFLCLFIYILLKKLFGALNLSGLAETAALLFVAHPIHTEVAANIKSADEILSLLFSVFALWHSVRFAETGSKAHALVCWLSMLAAFFSKESAAVFVIIIPLALYFFTSSSKRNILTTLGVCASAALLYMIARSSALDKAPDGIGIINNSLAGAPTFSERYGTIAVILLKYLKLLFYPHPLCWDYGYNQIRLVGFGDPMAILSLLIYVSLVGYAIAVLIRKISPKSQVPSFKSQEIVVIAFCILFYLIGLSVSSNIFVLIGSTMAERFLFTPSLAYVIVIAFGLIKLLKVEFSNARSIPLIIILALYSYKTYSRNQDWKNNITLFSKGVGDCPDSYRTNVTYAWESVLAGEKETNPQKKIQHMENAVTYYQKGLAIYGLVAADWYNLGVSLSNTGKADEGIEAYKRALAINPLHLNASYNLGTIYFSTKDNASSLKYFTDSWKSDSMFRDVAFKVGVNYQMMGDARSAIPFYESHFRRNPTDKNVITNLMIAYRSLNNTERANYFTAILEKIK